MELTSNISSKDAEEQHAMHSRGNNIKVTFYNVANEVAGELFDSFCSRYQENLETPMIRSDFIVYVVHKIYFKVHKVILVIVVHIFILETG